MWLLAAAMAHADCPDDAAGLALLAADGVPSAFADVDIEELGRAQEAFETSFPCVDRAFSSQEAVRIHIATALMHFVDADNQRVMRSLGAVKHLDPSWSPPSGIAPPGHPLRDLFAASEPAGDTVRVELMPPGGWVVDGVPTQDIPSRRAFVVQGLDVSGDVVLTGVFSSPAELPVSDLRALGELPTVPPSRKRVRAVGTIVAGVLVGTGLGLGIDAQRRANALDTVPFDELDAAQARVRTQGVAAGITAGAGVTVGVLSWAVKW